MVAWLSFNRLLSLLVLLVTVAAWTGDYDGDYYMDKCWACGCALSDATTLMRTCGHRMHADCHIDREKTSCQLCKFKETCALCQRQLNRYDIRFPGCEASRGSHAFHNECLPAHLRGGDCPCSMKPLEVNFDLEVTDNGERVGLVLRWPRITVTWNTTFQDAIKFVILQLEDVNRSPIFGDIYRLNVGGQTVPILPFEVIFNKVEDRTQPLRLRLRMSIQNGVIEIHLTPKQTIAQVPYSGNESTMALLHRCYSGDKVILTRRNMYGINGTSHLYRYGSDHHEPVDRLKLPPGAVQYEKLVISVGEKPTTNKIPIRLLHGPASEDLHCTLNILPSDKPEDVLHLCAMDTYTINKHKFLINFTLLQRAVEQGRGYNISALESLPDDESPYEWVASGRNLVLLGHKLEYSSINVKVRVIRYKGDDTSEMYEILKSDTIKSLVGKASGVRLLGPAELTIRSISGDRRAESKIVGENDALGQYFSSMLDINGTLIRYFVIEERCKSVRLKIIIRGHDLAIICENVTEKQMGTVKALIDVFKWCAGHKGVEVDETRLHTTCDVKLHGHRKLHEHYSTYKNVKDSFEPDTRTIVFYIKRQNVVEVRIRDHTGDRFICENIPYTLSTVGRADMYGDLVRRCLADKTTIPFEELNVNVYSRYLMENGVGGMHENHHSNPIDQRIEMADYISAAINTNMVRVRLLYPNSVRVEECRDYHWQAGHNAILRDCAASLGLWDIADSTENVVLRFQFFDGSLWLTSSDGAAQWRPGMIGNVERIEFYVHPKPEDIHLLSINNLRT